MQIWKAHFKDQFHDTEIDILNTEEDSRTNPISFVLDGVKFQGSSPFELYLADETQYETARNKFHILKTGGFHIGGTDIPYRYTLQRYSLEIKIPLRVIRDRCEIKGILHIAFELKEYDMKKGRAKTYCDDVRVYPDDVNVYDFTLSADGVSCSSAANKADFEANLYDICRQMANEYYIKCCFTCQYSDYSPYGNDDFGCMLCYKEEYLKVNGKDDHFEDKDCDIRQETYLCEEYAPRNKCPGDRGFVPGLSK